MRKSFWIIALLFVAFAATNARADVATLTFSGASTPYALSASDVNLAAGGGSLTFDLDLTISGTTYDVGSVTAVTGQSIMLGDSFTWDLSEGTNSSLFNFGLNDGAPVVDYIIGGTVPTNVSISKEIGTATLSATPEPSTAILWLTGIGLMILTRKRIANLLRPAPGTHGSLSPH